MTGTLDAERVLDAFLAPEHDQLADRVIEAALTDIARTPQRRAMGMPWRFAPMTNVLRAAAVAIVAIVGVGVLAFSFRWPDVGTVGPGPTPTPPPTLTPTVAPTPTPKPDPSWVAPGITEFTSFTSPVYGHTFGVPDAWTLGEQATHRFQEGDDPDSAGYSDWFRNPSERDGEEMYFAVWQEPAGAGADVATRDGLAAWIEENRCDDQLEDCATVSDVAIPMCVGKTVCGPAILVPLTEGTVAAFVDGEPGQVTLVTFGRPNRFPAVLRYGGGVQLVKSILETMDVWTPEPGQIPSGS